MLCAGGAVIRLLSMGKNPTIHTVHVCGGIVKNFLIICSLLALVLCVRRGAAEDLVLMRQNFNKEWVEVRVPNDPAQQAQRAALQAERVSSNMVAGNITFNITSEDDGVGFNDTTTGATRRATLESVLMYV